MTRTALARTATFAAALTLLAACGSTPAPTHTTAKKANNAPAPKVLDAAVLGNALLTAEELPPGFKTDGKQDHGPTKTYCNYKQPDATAKVGQAYASTNTLPEAMTFIAQYPDIATAKKAVDMQRDALKTCTTDHANGATYKIALAEAPSNIGDDIAAVSADVSAKGFTFHSLAYSTVVGAAVVGISYIDTDKPSASVVEPILQKAVTKYATAIGQAPAAAAASSSATSASPLAFNADGALKGDATPTFPNGAPGKVDVVQVGPLDKSAVGGGSVPIAFRNNTGYAISHVDFTATARDNGTLVATGNSQGTWPAQIQPGGIGLAYIYFDGTAPSPSSTYDFTADTTPADESSYNTATLQITEANRNGSTIVGTATNNNKSSVTGPYDVDVFCFDGDKMVGQTQDFGKQDADLKPGDSTPFSISLGNTKCPTFVVGSSGFFS